MPSLPGLASRTHIESLDKPRNSTSVLEALLGKLGIKRLKSGIYMYQFLSWFTLQTTYYEVIIAFCDDSTTLTTSFKKCNVMIKTNAARYVTVARSTCNNAVDIKTQSTGLSSLFLSKMIVQLKGTLRIT